MKLTAEQKEFFDTYGFLKFPGALKNEVGWIIEEHEALFASRKDIVHDGSQRTMFPMTFIDQREKLCTLLDHPFINGICEGLLGEDFLYEGGDGNFYSGDTGWHSDLMPTCGMYQHCRHIKIAFYLDPLTKDTGALRVIPGSHLPGDKFADTLQKRIWHMGVEGKDIPAYAVENQPGDLAVFHHNLKHASFGGGKRRRMFTMNLCQMPHTPEQKREVDLEMEWYGSQGVTQFHSEIMYRTASPERLRHLNPLKAWEPFMQEKGKEAREKREKEKAEKANKLEPAAAK